MRLSSTTLSIIYAVLFCLAAQNAFAHEKTEPSHIAASGIENEESLYIEMINENEVILDNKKLTLAGLEDILKNTLNDQPEIQTILYITDTQYVNQAYRLAFNLKRVTNKHIWVTYRP